MAVAHGMVFADVWERPVRRSLFPWLRPGKNTAHARYLEARVQPESPQALQWLAEAAEAGHPHAAFHLALAYQLGQGVKRDWKAAGKLFQQAAAVGCVAASYNLMLLDAFREDLATDAAVGAYWLADRAEAGDVAAQFILGRCFDHGTGGVRADPGAAARWYERAVEQNSPWAMIELAQMLEFGIGIVADPARALPLWRRAAEEHYARNAYLPLARMLDEGRGGLRDGEQAAHWGKKARGENIDGAREFLRTLPEGPLQRAIAMLARCDAAAAVGSNDFPPAHEVELLADDVFDFPDPETLPLSFALHAYGAKLGSAESHFQLGHRHRHGYGTAKNVQEALRCFHAAAAMGNVYAQEVLAEMHETGEGVPKDEETAMRWWRKALASGSYTARQRLGLKAQDGTLGSHFETGISVVPVGVEGAEPTTEALYGNVVGEFRLQPKPLVMTLLALVILGVTLIAKAPWIGGALLLGAVVLWKIAVSWRLNIFTNALEKKTLFKTTVVRLAQGTSIRYKTLRDPSTRVSQGTRAWVEVDDGTSSARFGRAVDQWPALHEMLQIAEERDTCGRALHAYSTKGEAIAMGPLRIEAGKLHAGRLSLALNQVRHVTLRNRRLRIVTATGRIFADVPLIQFPNAWTTLLVLESLLPFDAVEFAAIPARGVLQ